MKENSRGLLLTEMDEQLSSGELSPKANTMGKGQIDRRRELGEGPLEINFL